MEALIREGMDVARFNFSHGTHEEQKARLERLKTLREQFDRPIAALLDTKGPEIRIGCFKDGRITLKEEQEFTLKNDEVEGTQDYVTVSYKDLYRDVKIGDSILIDDGLVEMIVEKIEGKDIVCRVINGGDISNRKGVNVPGVELKMPFISPKDRDDLLFGIQEDFDFVAASFTRTADDIREMRKLLDDNGGQLINIIAKIENQQGVDNIDAIIEEADGIMVARGDMGVEIPLEQVPIIQQRIIQKVYPGGQGRDHGHPDAGFHDGASKADPCGGDRRCKCHPSGDECDHALRRDGCRQISGGSAEDDGEDRGQHGT